MNLSIPTRSETIRQFKEQGGQIAAVLPIHYSRGMLRAFNFLPVEVWGPPRIASGASSRHLQAYVCSICHNALSFLIEGGLDVTDLILVPHACDSLQGLGSLLLDFLKPAQTVLPLYIPREKREIDLEFLATEFKSIFNHLLEITGFDPGLDAVSACIKLEEKADDLLLRLHFANPTLALTNRDIYQVIRSREYLPAEEFINHAESALQLNQEKPRAGTPILIEGIVPEPMGIFDLLEEMNMAVVGDDLACCSRRLYAQGMHPDPFIRMAERILGAPPDPTRGSSIEERCEHLLSLAELTKAKGIIFYIVKFCEPEYFDIPILREILNEAGVASILIEVDMESKITHQIRTRLGAFMEMLI